MLLCEIYGTGYTDVIFDKIAQRFITCGFKLAVANFRIQGDAKAVVELEKQEIIEAEDRPLLQPNTAYFFCELAMSDMTPKSGIVKLLKSGVDLEYPKRYYSLPKLSEFDRAFNSIRFNIRKDIIFSAED